MKIGRNDSCPCNSGKKYKKCCIDKSEKESRFEAINSSMNNLRKLAGIEACLHPNNDECEGGIIKAHAIQNNRILKNVSEKGYLVTMNEQEFGMFQTSGIKGRKLATTFKGFCRKHDKQIFQPIEDSELTLTEEQIFLFTYRTMTWHFQKKKEQINANDIFENKMKNQGYSTNGSELDSGFLLADRDNNLEIADFDKALLSRAFDKVSSYVWKIPYEVGFTISMTHEIAYDLLGNRINDLCNNQRAKAIYLNIIPIDNSTLCIWSWLNQWDEDYKSFTQQFDSLSFEDKCNYLNNELPLWSDSLMISPRLWNVWHESVKQSFIEHANMDFLYAAFREESDNNTFEYMDTPWNLFQKIS